MIKLNELNKDELKKVYENNKELQKELYDSYYENLMYNQKELYDILLEGVKGYRYYDYYQSFYLKITDSYEFLKTIDYKILIDYGLTNQLECEACDELYEKYLNSDDYDENLLNKMNEKASNLLNKIEKELHSYEDISEDDIIEDFIDNIEFYDELYIENKEDFICYKHIDYIKSYK